MFVCWLDLIPIVLNFKFAALIHDVKHLGLPNAQLEKDKHCLSLVYSQGSYLERQSIQVGLSKSLVLQLCGL